MLTNKNVENWYWHLLTTSNFNKIISDHSWITRGSSMHLGAIYKSRDYLIGGGANPKDHFVNPNSCDILGWGKVELANIWILIARWEWSVAILFLSQHVNEWSLISKQNIWLLNLNLLSTGGGHNVPNFKKKTSHKSPKCNN